MTRATVIRKTGADRQRVIRWAAGVPLRTTPCGCIEWGGSLNHSGYGRVTYNGHRQLAHRVSFFEATGVDPTGKVVMHVCDNRKCINPDHLELGTQTDNSKDMWTKGRAVVPPRNGEKNGRAVLSWPIVREMRASSLSGSELARKYGVSAVMACRIKRGEAWRE